LTEELSLLKNDRRVKEILKCPETLKFDKSIYEQIINRLFNIQVHSIKLTTDKANKYSVCLLRNKHKQEEVKSIVL
jgi:hypothetical protein